MFDRPNSLCPPIPWEGIKQQVLIVHSCSQQCVVKCLLHDSKSCRQDGCKHPSANKVYHNEGIAKWEIVDRNGGFVTANVKATSKVRAKSVLEDAYDSE